VSLWLPPNGGIGKRQTNLTAADRDGTTITSAGTAHVKGAFSAGELVASADEDCYAITVMVTGVAVTVTDTSYLLDIGVGASGSERVLIQDLDCWGAGGPSGEVRAKSWTFPCFIAKGERVSARSQALAVSDVANVAVWLHQGGHNGYGMEVPTAWERLGTVTNSDGVSVTPGSGAFGSWTTILDPITKSYKWWHIGMGALNDTSIATGGTALVEVGIGDTSAAVATIGSWVFDLGTLEIISGPRPDQPVYWPIVADTVNGVFARIASFETEARSILVYAAE
jgi:hypothetical protein